MSGSPQNDAGELAKLFFKLGVIGFGGPAAHIAMMEDEVVERRGWMSRQRFLDMVGATNLIPGPNSTEMAIHIGAVRGGATGLVVAGTAFILPAVGITLVLAWLYVRYGTLPQADPILDGIRPVVVAIIFGALWKLSKKALKTKLLMAVAAAVAAAAFIGGNEVLSLLVGGVIAVLLMPLGTRPHLTPTDTVDPDDTSGGGDPDDTVGGGKGGSIGADGRGNPRGGAGSSSSGCRPESGGGHAKLGAGAAIFAGAKLPALTATLTAPLSAAVQVAGVSVAQLFIYFLTIGSVLYGSGYVLFAFLEGGLVNDLGWLTQQQLIDAVAIGQFTPGPVLSTATFVGYLVAGPIGALAATLGIFLPSFVFVSLLARILPWMRSSAWLSAFLDGVNASAVALMTVVTLRLAVAAFVSWETALIGLVAAVAAVRFGVNAAILVVAGAAAGWILA